VPNRVCPTADNFHPRLTMAVSDDDEEEEEDGDESEDETPEQRAAKMMEEKLRRYDIAKSMLHLSSKKWNRQPKNEALCWTFFREANLTKNTTISMLETNDQRLLHASEKGRLNG
jgi:hypothetical protein